MSAFENLVKSTGNELSISGTELPETQSFVDTGSYMLNALISGSIFGGIPSNKVTGFAGEEATGKTYFVLSCCKNWLDQAKNNFVVYFESENAVQDKADLINRGIDVRRFEILPVNTIEEFSTQCSKMLTKILSMKKNERPNVMMVLDSLGNLSTNKELKDIEEGNDKVDFTKPKKIRACFRAVTQKLARANVPFLLTNHIYQTMDAYDFEGEMGGGGGTKYACSSIVWLKKKKELDGKFQIGNIIRCAMYKSRITKEKTKGETRILFKGGLDRYHGLFDLAVTAEIVKKPLDENGKIKDKSPYWVLPCGKSVYESKIKKEPEMLYTPEVLTKIDEYVRMNFKYVSDVPVSDETVTEVEVEEIETSN